MLLSIAFFCLTCIMLWHAIFTWTHSDNGWCVVFTVCTFLCAFIFVDQAFYGGEFYTMFAEWVVALQYTK